MPDAAVSATQRQFARLIEAASGAFDVRLRLFDLETLQRSLEARRAMADAYRVARALRAASPDAIIVTGAEPRADDLRDEPFWDELGFCFDWADANVLSTLHSCLATHALSCAATGSADGAWRRNAPESSPSTSSPTTSWSPGWAGLPRPHSRWNGLDEAELAAKGYLLLARAKDNRVDLFIGGSRSLLVFLQGHPEYDADTLAREHRRDTLRFLRGEAPAPRLPVGYFPPAVAAAVADFVARAEARAAVPADYPAAALALKSAPWRDAGVRLARNWLALVARRKAARDASTFAVARWGG